MNLTVRLSGLKVLRCFTSAEAATSKKIYKKRCSCARDCFLAQDRCSLVAVNKKMAFLLKVLKAVYLFSPQNFSKPSKTLKELTASRHTGE